MTSKSYTTNLQQNINLERHNLTYSTKSRVPHEFMAQYIELVDRGVIKDSRMVLLATPGTSGRCTRADGHTWRLSTATH